MKLDHITLLVSDFSHSMPYYDALLPLLGFEKQKAHIYTDGKGFFFQFLESQPNTRPYERYGAGMNHLGFGVDDVKTIQYIQKTMQEKDFDVPEVQQFSDGVTALFMKDPDGIRFEISHYPLGAAVVG